MTLNNAIKQVQENYALPADTHNALHGATAGHPWCKGKSLEQRKAEAAFAVGGRVSNHDLEQIQKATEE